METTTKATVCILIVFSCCGTLLNGLVLLVFSKSRKKQTSTTYVLILSFVDILTCAFTIPLCIVMEILEYETESDILCKSYHLLATTTVPLSAMLIVVIAIDRYVRICTNNDALVAPPTIIVAVIVIVLFSVVLGSLCAMGYGVEKIHAQFPNSNGNFTEARQFFNTCNFLKLDLGIMPGDLEASFVNLSMDMDKMIFDENINYILNNSLVSMTDMFEVFGISICKASKTYFSEEFIYIYGKIYSMVYAISCLITIFIYIKIYHFIASRRKRSIRRYRPDVIMKPIQSSISKEPTHDELEQKSTRKFSMVSCASLIRSNFITKREKIRRQNIKTASMLACVAFVFITSFLPAWLMKYRFIPFNNVIFHLYFIYCVINPFIYAFCNSKFKTTLKQMMFNRRRTPFVL